MESLFVINDLVVANIGDDIAKGIRDFIGPILMLIIGAAAITFLFQREMTKFLIFIGLAAVVTILFFAPDVLPGLAESVEKTLGTDGDWENYK